MKKMYRVVYETYVVAGDREEAEEIAREMNLTIQDPSVKPTAVIQQFDSKIVHIAEKLVSNLFKIPGVTSDTAITALTDFIREFTPMSDGELDALYAHCERAVIYEED